jgi:hypothetical protein
MSARTLFHYFEIIANGANVRLDSDMRAELREALENQEQTIEALRQDVRFLRAAMANMHKTQQPT